jgi:SAM-dependent methyltransferase
MPWYDSWFSSSAYTLVYGHRDEDEAATVVDLIEQVVAPAPDASILDMACGRGRHARELARRGYRVTGVDLSADAVDEARAKAAAEGLDRVTFQQGDMREPVCKACFDGVVNLFTAFGYFEDDAENQRALAALSTALRPGGWLVQDYLNPPHVASTLVPMDTRTEDGVTVTQRRRIEGGRVYKEIELADDTATETHCESVRLYTRDDFARMYAAAGLDLQDTYGTYDGAPHSPHTPRLILHARKTSAAA